jgi:hypothetical protein
MRFSIRQICNLSLVDKILMRLPWYEVCGTSNFHYFCPLFLNMRFNRIIFLIITLISLAASCHEQKEGTLEINFTHTIDGEPVQFNELIYTNAAGNQYRIDEIKYFISKLTLINDKGEPIEIIQDEGIHYVDCSAKKTLRWKIEDIPQGKYIGISFVFGLDESDNISNRFVNPPECNFAWPDHLGGGYHYMQINGMFVDGNEKMQSLNIHTGIGQIYNANNEITRFEHNYLRLTFEVNFSIHTNTSLKLNMEIQRCFDTPNLYNFNDFGSAIMQNQHAQRLLRENAENVLTINH